MNEMNTIGLIGIAVMNTVDEEVSMMDDLRYEIAVGFRTAYTSGVFSSLFDMLSDNYEHISFWVLDVIRGKRKAIDYYTSKGNAIQRSNNTIKGTIVEVTSAPEKVRPHGIYRDGIQLPEDPVFLNRYDVGKIAVLLEQIVDGETVRTLAIPTIDVDGKCSQLLIAEPSFYSWKSIDESERLERF